MSIRRAVVLGLLCCCASVATVHASGGYAGVFTPPAVIDRAKFDIGKQIFTGTATLAGQVDATAQAAQQPILQRWQNDLPESQKKNVDLAAMAGRLSQAQLESLSHYIEVRFRIPASLT
jgi:hypothetical protein